MLCFGVVGSQGINDDADVMDEAAAQVLSSSNAHPEQQQQQPSAPGHGQADRALPQPAHAACRALTAEHQQHRAGGARCQAASRCLLITPSPCQEELCQGNPPCHQGCNVLCCVSST